MSPQRNNQSTRSIDTALYCKVRLSVNEPTTLANVTFSDLVARKIINKFRDRLSNISNTRDSISSHFQPPRRELKIRHVTEYFLRTSIKIVKIYASENTSKHRHGDD